MRTQTLTVMDICGILILLTAGIYLRIYDLSLYYFTFDDVWNLGIADESNLIDVLKSNWRNNVHPPLMLIILHYMLAISRNETFLRCISLIPSILLIPLFFSIGYRFIGRIAAFMMGLLVTIGIGPILLSTVIRPYSLLLLLLGLSLWSILLYKEKQQNKYLIIYASLCMLALLLNYSSVIFIASIALWQIFGVYFKNQKINFRLWFTIHGLFFITLLIEYSFNSYFSAGPDPSALAKRIYKGYQLGFDLNVFKFYFNLIWDMIYFSQPIGYIFALVLPCMIIYQIYRGKYDASILFINAITINIILSAFALYPFLNGRWTIYLLPFFLLLMGETAQEFFNSIKKYFSPKKINLILIGSLFLALAFGIKSTLSTPKTLYSAYNWEYFTQRDDYDNIVNHLLTHFGKHDIALIEKQMAWYFLFDKNNIQMKNEISKNFYSLTYKNKTFYYYDTPGIINDCWINKVPQQLISDIHHLNFPINNVWFIGVSGVYDSNLVIIKPYLNHATLALPSSFEEKINKHIENIHISHASPPIGVTYSVKWDHLR